MKNEMKKLPILKHTSLEKGKVSIKICQMKHEKWTKCLPWNHLMRRPLFGLVLTNDLNKWKCLKTKNCILYYLCRQVYSIYITLIWVDMNTLTYIMMIYFLMHTKFSTQYHPQPFNLTLIYKSWLYVQGSVCPSYDYYFVTVSNFKYPLFYI